MTSDQMIDYSVGRSDSEPSAHSFSTGIPASFQALHPPSSEIAFR